MAADYCSGSPGSIPGSTIGLKNVYLFCNHVSEDISVPGKLSDKTSMFFSRGIIYFGRYALNLLLPNRLKMCTLVLKFKKSREIIIGIQKVKKKILNFSTNKKIKNKV
jgi:hypothetical protein